VAADLAFRAACQRYAHGNGSSYAVAEAALAAIGHTRLVEILRETEKFTRSALEDRQNTGLQANIHDWVVHVTLLRETLAAVGAEPLA
jgi:hypothetical protein